MSKQGGVGILGIGVYLPDEVRTNDWWPEPVVARWRAKLDGIVPEQAPPGATPGVLRTLRAIAALRGDPFQGAKERRVASAETPPSTLETLAAERALHAASVAASEVDAVLGYSFVPDYLSTPNAALVHRALGLPRDCFVTTVDGVCNAFQQQLLLARRLIEAGDARHVLLLQSSVLTRLLPTHEPYSAWFGDGATAVVVGRVAEGYGLLGALHRTDGERHNAMVTGVPGARWHDEGRVVWYPGDRHASAVMLRTIAERSRDSIHTLLARAGERLEDVDFYACHQATTWLRGVTQQESGLDHARTVDTFPWAGSLTACNLPLVLAMAERERQLSDGDRVVLFSGGSGETWTSSLLRWGRG